MTKELMTTEEVAGYLRLNRMTIYKMVKSREIAAIKVRGEWRFDKPMVNEWLENNMTQYIKPGPITT